MTEETTMEAPPKRRGRPPNAAKLAAPQDQMQPQDQNQPPVPYEPKQEQTPLDYDEITYIPGDSDPTNTVIDFDPSRPGSGLKFHARLPVKVKRSRTITQLLVQKRITNDGNTVTQAVEQKVPLVEVLRHNHRFSINGKLPSEKPVAVIQYDPDWYRGYAQKWIALSSSLRVMNERWDEEAQMRVECGCDNADESYLHDKLEYMRKRLAIDV